MFNLQPRCNRCHWFAASADESAAKGDWSSWVANFTPDVHYLEHLYGSLHGVTWCRSGSTRP